MYENFTEQTSEKKIIFFQNFNQRQCITLENKKDRSSRWQMLFKIGVLKNFASFTGKHLCWSLFLKKLFEKDLLLKETSRQVLSLCSRAPHALVPHVPRALRAPVPHVPRALRTLVLLVPHTLRVLALHVSRVLRALVFYLPRALRALVLHLSSILFYFTCLVPCMLSCCL